MYTLHWLILDAAAECEDNLISTSSVKTNSKLQASQGGDKSPSITSRRIISCTYLHSVATIQLFIYLFAPILKHLKPSDLDNLKLSNGLKIWEPLWAYRQPGIKIFNTPVKKKEQPAIPLPCSSAKTSILDRTLSIRGSRKSPTNMSEKKSPENDKTCFGDIYMGTINETQRKDSKDNLKIESSRPSPTHNDSKSSNIHKSSSFNERLNLSLKLKDQTHKESIETIESASQLKLQLSNKANDGSNVEPKESENYSLHISDIDNDKIRDSSSTIFDKPKAPLVHMSSICSISDNSSQVSTPLPAGNSPKKDIIFNLYKSEQCPKCQQSVVINTKKINEWLSASKCTCPQNEKLAKSLKPNFSSASMLNEKKDSIKEERFKRFELDPKKIEEDPKGESMPFDTSDEANVNIKDATYFDIGVMRCLLSPKWNTEGYLWALEYLSHRVLEISDFILKEQDKLFKFKSPSVPSNMNDLFVLMGVGAKSDINEDLLHDVPYKNQDPNYASHFIDLINQIFFENDMSTNKSLLKNPTEYSKRRRYEANFQTRIRYLFKFWQLVLGHL